jgi:hypothetical protein
MSGINVDSLTKELYEPGISPHAARAHLEESRKDVTATYDVAGIYGNKNPNTAGKHYYDKSLMGTGVLAWALDIPEIKETYPFEGIKYENTFGSKPIIAYNPDILKTNDKEFTKAVVDHEKAHLGQQGKIQLKQIHAFTNYGVLPLGMMLVEGGVEYALEKSGRKPPTRYMDERSSKKQPYSVYRDFVYELEERQHGIMRQVYRAAARAGPRAAGRLLEAVPEFDQLLNKYSAKLNSIQSTVN